MSFHRIAFAAVLGSAFLCTSALAQSAQASAIRCIGPYHYYSDWGRNCTYVAAGMTGAALHADGSLHVWGMTTSGRLAVPPLPAGLQYVDVAVTVSGAVIALRSDHALLAWGPNWYGETNVPAAPPGRHFTALARHHTGNHCAALLSDGTIVEWGAAYQGAATAPPLPAGLSWTQVAIGGIHALGLRSDGSVAGWGHNYGGSLNVPALPAGLTYTGIAVSSFHSLLLRSDGSAVCLGNNPDFGPLPALPPGVSYIQVAGGSMNFALLRSDGVVVTHGQSFPTSPYRIAPVPPLPPGLRYLDVAVGVDFVLARRSDGELVGWGRSGHAEINVPASPPGVTATDLRASGFWQNSVLRSDGTLAIWGDYWNYAYPQPVWPFDLPALPAGVTYRQIAAGYGQVLALRSDGQMVAVGLNVSGETQVPALPPGTTWVGIGCSEYTSYGLRSDGAAIGFGLNNLGQCNVPAPPAGLRYLSIDGGENCSIALRSDGQLVAFGDTASFGQGQVPPLPSGLRWHAVRVGKYHAVGLRSDGALIAWGSNNAGQCNVPALPAGVCYVEAVASRTGLHTVARRSDGTVVAFGDNSQGQCTIPPPGPGRGHTGVGAGDTFTLLREGPPSTYVRLGVGCAGSRPPAQLIPRDTPRIGASLELEISNLPVDVAIVCTGFDPVNSSLGPLPLDLGGLGLPGCTLRASLDVVHFVAGSSGRARLELSIPYQPLFVGMQFQQQALVVDPGASNALGAAVSDAATARIGR